MALETPPGPRKGQSPLITNRTLTQPLLPPESGPAGMKAMEVTCPDLLFRLARISSSSRNKPRSSSARSRTGIRRLSPSSKGIIPDQLSKRRRLFWLHDAQLVLARQYGSASWAPSERRSRTAGIRFFATGGPFRSRCGGGRVHSGRARALALEPDLARADRWAALAAGEVALIEKEIRVDPSWVNFQGGSKGDWTPLLYVSFSCLQMENADCSGVFVDCARLLLDAGADSNAAWVHPYWKPLL